MGALRTSGLASLQAAAVAWNTAVKCVENGQKNVFYCPSLSWPLSRCSISKHFVPIIEWFPTISNAHAVNLTVIDIHMSVNYSYAHLIKWLHVCYDLQHPDDKDSRSAFQPSIWCSSRSARLMIYYRSSSGKPWSDVLDVNYLQQYQTKNLLFPPSNCLLLPQKCGINVYVHICWCTIQEL